MSYQFSFERLEVWQSARRFSCEVYRETQSFPSEERFGLVSQLRRAAVSVASNLAEGGARLSGKEQARFSEIAYASLMEVMCQLIIANDLNYLDDEELNEFRTQVHVLSAKINALKNAQARR
jgi:four helix bundle protein